jgi:hypothetical protein
MDKSTNRRRHKEFPPWIHSKNSVYEQLKEKDAIIQNLQQTITDCKLKLEKYDRYINIIRSIVILSPELSPNKYEKLTKSSHIVIDVKPSV